MRRCPALASTHSQVQCSKSKLRAAVQLILHLCRSYIEGTVRDGEIEELKRALDDRDLYVCLAIAMRRRLTAFRPHRALREQQRIASAASKAMQAAELRVRCEREAAATPHAAGAAFTSE